MTGPKRKNVNVIWHSIVADADIAEGGWVAVRNHYSKNYQISINALVSADSVYVIRLTKPWSVIYKNLLGEHLKHSPVIYVGRGDFKKRFTSHLKNRICEMAKHFEAAEWETRFCSFSAREDGSLISRALEAALILRFKGKFGRLPLLNKREESENEDYTFSKQTTSVIQTGSGKGFHYGIWPLPTNRFYAAAASA